MTESDSKVITITGGRRKRPNAGDLFANVTAVNGQFVPVSDGPVTTPAPIFLSEITAPAPAPAKSKRKRKARASTESEERSNQIRALLVAYFRDNRPRPAAYIHMLVDAGIRPTGICARYGTYERAAKAGTRFRKAINSEFSRLWRTRYKK
jgi:hypothetical protein